MSKRRIVFTDTMIKKLKPKEKKYAIGEGNGFNIRVIPSGAKTWLYLYKFGDTRREMNLGTYPAVTLETARTKFEEARKKVKNGIDPIAELEQAATEHTRKPNVTRLINEYVDTLSKAKMRTWKEDERILKKDVLPVWGTRKVADITRLDVMSLLESMHDRGAAIRLNTFKIIRRMYSYAFSKEYVVRSPCYQFRMGKELPVVPARDRILSEAEVKTFWEGLDKAGMTDNIKRALKLILVTCQRPGEVVTMHRDQIDGRWWEFMPKPTKVTMEIPRAQRIYLTDLALELIGDAEGYIFETSHTKLDKDGNPIPTPMTERSIACALRRNLKDYQGRNPADGQTSKESKIVKEEKKIALAHFTPHDLRRTGATFISKLGHPDEVVDVVLAHLKKGIIKTYNRNTYDDEKKRAMLDWEGKIKSILASKPASAGQNESEDAQH